jgi:hypothetical protein
VTGRLNSLEDFLEVVTLGERHKTLAFESVEADGDAVETFVREGLYLVCEDHPIGGQGEVFEWFSPKHSNQARQVSSQQRLAAGESNLPHAQRDEVIYQR